MVIHGGRVLSTYTHVSDQWSTFGTKQIVPTAREGHYTLDELLGNATDLPITEHATDTHGATLVNFGLFDLVSKALTPRIRDLGKITMLRVDAPGVTNARYPHAGSLLADRWNEDLRGGGPYARPGSTMPVCPSCSTREPAGPGEQAIMAGTFWRSEGRGGGGCRV
ncbi:Tn3 family transposase [Nonomuraea sp. NPDC049480]|uniref:Tn3 family transposase n=1 Tax=Nonomuraea sp. NPDC049480 TaxID=3364353 RepID=UPI0037A34C08